MAITTVPRFTIPDQIFFTSTGSQAISASTHALGFLLQAPQSGDLDSIKFRTATVTTGDTVRVSFREVDLSTGNPSAIVDQYRDITIIDTNDNVSLSTGLITSDGTNTGSKRTVAAGDYFFVCFHFPSYVAGNLAISTINALDQTSYQAYFNGTSWAKSASVGNLCLVYNSSGIVSVGTSSSVHAQFISSTNTYNSTSTPDERANKFSLPVSVRVNGVKARIDADGAFDLVIYESDGNTVVSSLSIDPDVRINVNTGEVVYRLATPVTLLANTTYYVAVKPTTSTSLTLQKFVFFNADDRASTTFGTNWTSSSRTDGGLWTDATTEVHYLTLVCDGIETGGGSGGPLINPFKQQVIG